MKYILVGNPNVGKTTFFNLLTDSNDKVSNFAGTTVDITTRTFRQLNAELIDLPGVRALANYSEDEFITSNIVFSDSYDKVINILDSNNLKRNLHLSIQLLETGKPVFFVLNMLDEVEEKGIKIDVEQFQEIFGPAILISAKQKKETRDVLEMLNLETKSTFKIDYGTVVEQSLTEIEALITTVLPLESVNPRSISLQILSKNEVVFNLFDVTVQNKLTALRTQVEDKIIKQGLALSLNGLLFKARRTFIAEVIEQIVTRTQREKVAESTNEKTWVDKITLNKYLGVPLFFLIFYLIFYLTFLIGNPITDFLEGSILVPFGDFVRSFFENINMPELVTGLVIDGAFAGFSTIVMFFPQIILVFIFLSILEGSGYTSRAIVLFDRVFSSLGLNGKALAPLMIGMGCSVPAIMAARTIPDKKERTITQLIIPFVSCAARLEIYIFFIGIFFSSHQALILLFINTLGFVVALISAKIFSLTFFKKDEHFFMVEIPPFRMINFVYIYKMARNKTIQFFKNAGKFIMIGSIVVWLLLNFGLTGYVTDINDSFYALIGHLFAWVFVPLGFGFWQATSSLITGFLAKELVVAQLGVLLAGYPSLAEGLQSLFSPAAAMSFMVFNLLYIPCLSTVAVLKQELKSWKWVGFSIGYSFLAAYIVSFIVYILAKMFI